MSVRTSECAPKFQLGLMYIGTLYFQQGPEDVVCN